MSRLIGPFFSIDSIILIATFELHFLKVHTLLTIIAAKLVNYFFDKLDMIFLKELDIIMIYFNIITVMQTLSKDTNYITIRVRIEISCYKYQITFAFYFAMHDVL